MDKIILKIYHNVYFLHKMQVPILPAILNKVFVRLLFGCQIGLGAQLGNKCILAYGGLGITIHDRAVIGDNVVIGTGVTIGGTTKKYEVPVIGENCFISTGAKIIGPVKVGKNCVIGANAVVISDVPDNSVAVGVPAKIIKRDIDIADYI